MRIGLQSFEFLQIFPPSRLTHKGMSKKGSRVMAVRGRGGEGLEVVRHKVTVTRESPSGQGEGLQAVLEQVSTLDDWLCLFEVPIPVPTDPA